MDQQPGKDLPSGTEVKAKAKRKAKKKKPNGKSNGKTNWKGMAQELSQEVSLLREQSAEMQQMLIDREEDLDDQRRIINSLKLELKELRQSAMGEREKVVLRNLRHFHGQILNAQLHCEEDRKKLDKFCEEVSHCIRTES